MRRRFRSLIGSLHRDASRSREGNDNSVLGTESQVESTSSREGGCLNGHAEEGHAARPRLPSNSVKGLQSQRMGRRLHRPPPASPVLTTADAASPEEPPADEKAQVSGIPRMPSNASRSALSRGDVGDVAPSIKRIKLNNGLHMYRDCARDEYFAIPHTCMSMRTRDSNMDPAATPTSCPEAEEAHASQRNFASHGIDFLYFLNSLRSIKEQSQDNANIALLRWAVLRKARSLAKLQNPTYCHQIFVRISGRLSPRIRYNESVTASPEFVEQFPYYNVKRGILEKSNTDASRMLILIDRCCSKLVIRQGDPHRGRPPQYSFVTAKVSHRTCTTLQSALSPTPEAVDASSGLKFENINLSFALARPTCDLTLNRKAAAATPKAFQLGGPLANTLLASEWQSAAEIQSLMLSQFVRTMLCGESSRFIHIKSSTEYQVWDIVLEDFKIQFSNFTHLFSVPTTTGCQDGCELLTHSLIKLPFYAVRWESMPDHAQTPCHILQNSTRLNIQGSIVGGWPVASSAALTCPVELKLVDVSLDQLPEYLTWAIYHCPEQVPCKVWVNDPHSGLVVSPIPLPTETQQSHFMIDNFRYSVARGSSSPPLSFDMISTFVASAFDTYHALFHTVMEASWQLLRSDTHRPALLAMLPDSERRSLLKQSCRDLNVIRSQLDQGLPFGQGWMLSYSSSALPNTSLSIHQLKSTVEQLLRTLASTDMSLSHGLNSALKAFFTAESIHTMTWSGDSFLYLASLLRPRPSSKHLGDWQVARVTHHVIDASNAAAMRSLMLLLHITQSMKEDASSVDEVTGQPIHLLTHAEDQSRKTFATELRWLNYPLALDGTYCSESFHNLCAYLARSQPPEATYLKASLPLFVASYSTSEDRQSSYIRELLPTMDPSEMEGSTNAKVVRFLVQSLPSLSKIAHRLLLPPKPSLCMTSSGQLVAVFKVTFVPPNSTEISEDRRNALLCELNVRLFGFLSDYSRSALMHELRNFVSTKPIYNGVGFLFFHLPIIKSGFPSAFRRALLVPTINPPQFQTENLLTAWESCLASRSEDHSRLWLSLRALLDVYDDDVNPISCPPTNDDYITRALPLAISQRSAGRVQHTDEWDRMLVRDAALNTAGALMALMFSSSHGRTSHEVALLLLKGFTHQSFSRRCRDLIEALVTESLFKTCSETPGIQNSPAHFDKMAARVLTLFEMKPRNVCDCICALSGLVMGVESFYMPYRPSLCANYDTLTPEGMSSVAKIVSQVDSLPTLRLMIYEGETPALRNTIKKAIGSVEYLWNGVIVCVAIRRTLFQLLYKAFAILDAIVQTEATELFKKGSSLYEHWHKGLTLLQEVKWLHCLVLKCPDNFESALCNLLCSIAWMILSLLLGRFTSAVRWSEYAFIASLTMKSPNMSSKRVKAALDQISACAIVLLTASAYFLNDPDLTVVFGTLARSLRESLVDPLDVSDIASEHFSFQIGPPDLPPTSMKMLARIPCRKRVYSLISELEGDGSRQSLFELLEGHYIPYDVRTLLAFETNGKSKDLTPVEKVEIENCESTSILLYHLACTATFRKINLLSENQSLVFTHSALSVLGDAIRKLDGISLYNEAPKMTAEDSKSIRRAMKAEYTRILRVTTLWTRGNNGLAASLGIGRPKCFRYEHALASTDVKFAMENESIKSQGEDLWWCAEPVPCIAFNSAISEIACGEYHTVCLSSDRKHLIVLGSTRSGQLGFTLETYRRVLRPVTAAVGVEHPRKEAFRILRRNLQDNYLEQFVFHNLKLGVTSQMSSNYADIKYHLPWSIARPLMLSLYASNESQEPIAIRQIGAGASYTALLPEDSSDLIIFGRIIDNLDETSSTGSTECTKAQSVCRRFTFPAPPQKLSCGPFHIAIITDDRRLFIWGKGDAGQLGLPMNERTNYDFPKEMVIYRYSPVSNNDQTPTNLIATYFLDLVSDMGSDAMDVLFEHGHIWWSQESQNLLLLIDSPFPQKELQQRIERLLLAQKLQKLEFLDIACGEAHNIAIARWDLEPYRFLVCWGQNECGQLGNSNLQFHYKREDYQRQNLHEIVTRFEACMSELTSTRQTAKPFLDFVHLPDETIEPLSVFAGGTSSACLINLDLRSIFLWGNNDRGCLSRPEDKELYVPRPIEVRFDQDISKVHLCLGDPYTLIRFADGSVKTFGALSGLGGTMPRGGWTVPRAFEFSTVKNWLTANRLSEKQTEAQQKRGREYYEVAEKRDGPQTISEQDAGRVRIPFGIHDVALGSAHSAFVVDTQRDLIENLPRVVVRRSCLLKTARSVQRDSATSTRTSTASDGRDVAGDLYDLIEQGPFSQEDTMNKILVDLKRPWDPPLPNDLKAWVREGGARQNGESSRMSSPPRHTFLEQVGTSGLQGLTHLSQLLLTNVVQKGIENMDEWIDRQSRRESALASPGTSSPKKSDRPKSTLTMPHNSRHMTPLEGSPRAKTRHERVPTHRSLEAPLNRERAHRHVLPDFGGRAPICNQNVSQEAWDELNMKLACRSQPRVSDVLTQAIPKTVSGYNTPQRPAQWPNSTIQDLRRVTNRNTTATQHLSPIEAQRTAGRATSRSGSERTASIQAGSSIYVPRQCVRPRTADTLQYRPPPLTPMWHLSRPMYSNPPPQIAVNRSLTGPRITTAHARDTNAMYRPLHPPHSSQPYPRPRILDFDGQNYSTLPPSSSNSPDSMIYHG